MVSQVNVYLQGGRRVRLGIKAQDVLVGYLKDKLQRKMEENPLLSQSQLEKLGYNYVERWLSFRLGRAVELTQGGALNVAHLVNVAVNDVLMEAIREGR